MTKIDWENITNYIESVGTTDTSFPFAKAQSSVKVTNGGGSANLIYTIGSQTGTLTPGQSITVNENVSSITLRSSVGNQSFQVWAVEAGTEKDEDTASDVTAQLANITSQYTKRINLFDPTRVRPNGYISGGNITNYTAGGISDFIPVTSGNPYTFTSETYDTSTGAHYVFSTIGCYFDSSKNYISDIPAPTELTTTVIIPANVAYARINYGNTIINQIKFVAGYTLEDQLGIPVNISSHTRFYGKKVSFLGDSITYGYGLLTPNYQRWSSIVAQKLGLSAEDNQGNSGTLIAHQAGNNGAFVDRYTSLAPDTELVIVMGGINDYYNGTGVMGAVDSTNTSEFYGALNTLITGLQNRYPTKDIVFITPLTANANGHNTDVNNASSGTNLKGYRDAIITRCNYYGVPVLDLFAISGFDFAHNDNHKNLFSQDGLHPNASGHRKIAEKIFNFIKTI